MTEPVGIYVSIPFCRSKCTFCNFASAAFPPQRMEAYVDRLLREIEETQTFVTSQGLVLPPTADSLFFGGGTPSLLSPVQMARLLSGIRKHFRLTSDAEITVEAAPGQISDGLLQVLLENGVNRISLGVQSFVDAESRAVGRQHTSAQCMAEIDRLHRAGIPFLNIDLIAGLPLQTRQSWQVSLDRALAAAVGHVSVYMLEIDEDSRLGSAVLERAVSQLAVVGQQARYHADAVPDADFCATLYQQACDVLQAAGIGQYEISNFARTGQASRHNLKYWQRAPYVGLGLDAHSMLRTTAGHPVRFATTDDFETYLNKTTPPQIEYVTPTEAFEESVFLGLRLVDGIFVRAIEQEHGQALAVQLSARAASLADSGVLHADPSRLRLTPHGRAISSSVFAALLA